MEILGAALLGAATGVLIGLGGDRFYIANPLSIFHNLLKTLIVILLFGGSAYLVTTLLGNEKTILISWGLATVISWRLSEDWSRKRRGAAGTR